MKQKENINSILYFSSPDAVATKSNLLKEPFTIILVGFHHQEKINCLLMSHLLRSAVECA